MGARGEEHDQFVDTALLIAAQELAHRGWTADRPTAWAVDDGGVLLDLFQMPLPDTGASRRVHAGHVVVHDAEPQLNGPNSLPFVGVFTHRCLRHRAVSAEQADVGAHTCSDR